jgi:hypothetical protein
MSEAAHLLCGLLCGCASCVQLHTVCAAAYLLYGCVPSVRLRTFCTAAYLLCGCASSVPLCTFYATAHLLSGCSPSVLMRTFYQLRKTSVRLRTFCAASMWRSVAPVQLLCGHLCGCAPSVQLLCACLWHLCSLCVAFCAAAQLPVSAVCAAAQLLRGLLCGCAASVWPSVLLHSTNQRSLTAEC